MVRFGAQAFAELPRAWRYGSEILHQTALLIIGTTLLVVLMQMLIGNICGVFSSYLLRSLGAVDYTGVITTLCVSRGVVPLMAGYILAAKVGCGFVAELGSMRIADELDAFESVGLDPMRFVVATRLAAMILYLPLMYIVSEASSDFGAYFGVVHLVGDVAPGTFEAIHWGIRNPFSYVPVSIMVFVTGVLVAIVSMFYGWTVRGGPAAVGEATARAIVVNLILVHLVYGLGTVIFFGLGDPGLSIGG
jgi:phospholipid/cholesterol/gamma-HCH transport system permease protein